jgi:hypothetical protein
MQFLHPKHLSHRAHREFIYAPYHPKSKAPQKAQKISDYPTTNEKVGTHTTFETPVNRGWKFLKKQ